MSRRLFTTETSVPMFLKQIKTFGDGGPRFDPPPLESPHPLPPTNNNRATPNYNPRAVLRGLKRAPGFPFVQL